MQDQIFILRRDIWTYLGNEPGNSVQNLHDI